MQRNSGYYPALPPENSNIIEENNLCPIAWSIALVKLLHNHDESNPSRERSSAARHFDTSTQHDTAR